MAGYKTTLPTGEVYKFQAPDDETAANAVRELHATAYGGGKQPQFGQAFGSSPEEAANIPDNPELAAAMDERIHGEADTRGAAANIGNALTMGWGDETMGVFGGIITMAQGRGFDEGYQKLAGSTRGDIANYRERFPKSALAQDIIGGAVPLVAGGLAAKGISAAVPQIARIAGGGNVLAPAGARIVTSALGGGVSGAVSGAGYADPGNRLQGAVEGGTIGALTGGVAGGIGAQIGRTVGRRTAAAALPTQQGMKDAAQSAFRGAETSGVKFSPAATANLGRIRTAMMGPNPNIPKLLPGSHDHAIRALDAVDRLATQTGGNLSDVMTIRGNIQDFANAAKGGSKDQAATLRILDAFDDWMDRVKPADLTPGRLTPDQAFGMWTEGRQLWGRSQRTKIVEKIVDSAKKKAGGSLGNAKFANELRKGFQKLTENDRNIKWFSDADRQAIANVAKGGNWGKTLGVADALLPGIPRTIPGVAKTAGYGTAAGMIPGAAPIIAGLGGLGTTSRIIRNVGTRTAKTRAVNQIKGGTGAVPYDRAAAAVPQEYATRLTQAIGQPVASRQLRPPGEGGDTALDLGSTFQPGTGGGYVPIRR